jgi:hypothetical protein
VRAVRVHRHHEDPTVHGGLTEHLRTTARACVEPAPSADVAVLADVRITAHHAVRTALPLLHPGTTPTVPADRPVHRRER